MGVIKTIWQKIWRNLNAKVDIYFLVALEAFGLFVCSIAFITVLKSEDNEMASVLIGHTIVGLVIGIMTMLIVLVFYKT